MNQPNEDLRDLPREALPPGGLEDATVEALWARGLLRPAPGRRRSRPAAMAVALAAAILLFLGGVGVGRRGNMAPTPSTPQFALLLYEGPEYRHPAPGEDAARVREYSTWAGARAARGELVAGEKLRESPDVVIGTDGAVSTGEPITPAPRLAGFFVIRAADAGRAVELARSCPHVRYGGSIVVREIEPT